MNSPAVTLTPEQEAMAQRVAQLIAPVKPGPVLTREEAMLHTKHRSDSAFDDWCGRMKVKPCSRGRYSRGHLDRALLKEASQRRAA